MDNKPLVYLDWNIINKLWAPSAQREENRADFSRLERLLEDDALIAPYSNAHMRDSARGVVKHPEYARTDAAVITRTTKNLCVTQYWGERTVKWHYRDAAEFLDATVNDSEFVAASFSELFSSPDLGDDGTLASLHSIQMTLLDMQQLPDSFAQCYKADPIFSLMFPRTKVKNTMLSLCEDIYDFSRVMMSDHVLYKQFRKFLNNAKARSGEVRKVSKELGEKTDANPAYLSWDEL